MDIELRELSDIYLKNLHEEEEGGGDQKGPDVGAHAKAIRYQARRDNVPLPKAFNDYVSKNSLSGTERTALRQKLGFMGEEIEVLDEKEGCNHNHKGEECPVHGKEECPTVKEEESYDSKDKIMKKAKPLHKHLYKNLHKGDTKGDVNEHFSWRSELSEYASAAVAAPKPKTEDKSKEKITEKKVKNTVVINPPQGMTEAIEEIGGQILEMVEVDEAVYGGEPEKKKDTRMTVTAADKKANTKAYQNYKAGDKRYKAADHMGEAMEDDKQALAMRKRQLSNKEMLLKKQHMLDKQKIQKQKTGQVPAYESTEDSLKDRQLERGGHAVRSNYNKPVTNTNVNFGKKKPAGGMSALDRVKADIRSKYGQGAIIDTKRKG